MSNFKIESCVPYGNTKNDLEKQYWIAGQKSIEHGRRLKSLYDTQKMRYIQDMLTYLKNQFNGFGKRNDENYYQDIRKEDVTGQLYQEAQDWFEIAKEYLLIDQKICELNRKRM